MSASSVVKTAEAVAASLADVPSLTAFNAVPVVDFAPDFTLKEMETLRCAITPVDLNSERESRASVTNECKVDVCFLKKVSQASVTNLDALVKVVEDCIAKLWGDAALRPVADTDYRLVKIDTDGGLYQPALLYESNVFCSFLNLTFTRQVD